MQPVICLFLLMFSVSARSLVQTRDGVVAASQTLAAQAGAQMLARGGSAADAAIAANAVLTVVEPMMNGIGGDLFAIVRTAADGKKYGLNASGWAPQALTREKFKPQGIHSVTVPGCVAGWAALHAKFGKLPWADLFGPAIYYAEQGFPVTEWIAQDWGKRVAKLRTDPHGAQVYLPGGRAPVSGTVFRNPALAQALRLIAREGETAFYKGSIAQALLGKSRALGGTMSAEDLAEFRPEWIEPVSTTYRGWTVWELPPNSQGIAALEMLNLMERFDLPKMQPYAADTLHLKMEAQKLAYADLRRYVADLRMAQVPVAGLISKPYAAARAKQVNPKKAACDAEPGQPIPGEGDTIYLAAADAEGNLVSFIQSIYQSFGSGIAVAPYGFHLHNRGALFSTDPDSPNVVAPRKRPFHTIIPALMEKGSQAVAFGIMGGLNQAQAHAQYVSYVVDHGMNLQQAMEAPRFTKPTFGGCDVMVESRMPFTSVDALNQLGHKVQVVEAYAPDHTGGGQAISVDFKTQVKQAASDPRKDGAAVPQSAK